MTLIARLGEIPPGKSKKFLLEGYNDTDRTLRGREPRSGRVKGAVPEAE